MSKPGPTQKTKNQTRAPSPAKHTRLIIARGDHLQAIHIRPRTMVAAGISLAMFSLLYFGTTAYLVLRDGTPGAGSEPQEQLREHYEDRISALRNEIERITSRRLVDHATVEQKVDQLLDRQAALGERQEMLSRLTEAARRAGFDIPAPPVSTPATGPQASAAPVALPSVTFASVASSASSSRTNQATASKMDQIEDQIASMEDEQNAAIDQMTSGLASRADRIARVLKRLGRKIPPPPGAEDVGGPFVPMPMDTEDERFQASVETLDGQFERLAHIRSVALSLPLGKPLPDASMTSGFGPRIDPFLGRPAMHTGIDYRAPSGSPARAVAAGTVIAAEQNSGYGNMVDVDHGNGVVTRYGHLSAITVRVGDKVAAGGKIGRVGSTGRATGPHLHYEIRIDGDAINPMRYIQAGEEISALL